jgi:hypothetical protein
MASFETRLLDGGDSLGHILASASWGVEKEVERCATDVVLFDDE